MSKKILNEKVEYKKYTLEEVKKHKKKGDCWVVVDKNVIDVTKFLDDHPGGVDIILDQAGTDITDEFEKYHYGNTAYEQMLALKIGEIA